MQDRPTIFLKVFPIRNIQEGHDRFFQATNTGYILGFIFHLLFIPLFYFLGIPVMAWYNVLSIIIYIIAFSINRKAYHGLALLLVVMEISIHAILAIYYLGWASGFFVYIVINVLLVFFHPQWSRMTQVLFTVLFTSVYLLLKIYSDNNDPLVRVDPDIFKYLYYMNSFFVLSSVGIIAYYYSSAARTAEKRLSNIIVDVKKMASTDLLTKISNRRHMQEIIENEINRYQRNKKKFSLIICDIDHFKQFNDLHGHECGDFILKETSRLLASSIRKADYLGRWGGEEFVVLLPETDVKGARKVAQKIRIDLEKNSSIYKGKHFKITMTFGVSEFLPDDNFDSCLNRADKAMYSGKKKGRNIVV